MKDITFTKTMIQNYNRVNAIPELVDGRFYNRNHLVYLYYINLLKSDFSLKEIKETLDSLNVTENMLEVYNDVMELKTKTIELREQYINNIKALTTSTSKQNLLLMLETVEIKNKL